MIIFISPHLDDVALSCGGFVHQCVQAGRRVVVISVCTANAPPRNQLSATALRIHDTEWRLGDQPYVPRRAEDLRACALLGVEAIHLNLPDAIYRHDTLGNPYYLEDFMDGKVMPNDFIAQGQRLQHELQAVLSQLMARLKILNPATEVTCVAPLALGGHIDHVITRHSVEHVFGQHDIPIQYYEDFPYAEKDDVLSHIDMQDKSAHTCVLAEADIQVRIDAIVCYQSQLEAVFHVEQHPNIPVAVAQRVRRYIAYAGGERYWQIKH